MIWLDAIDSHGNALYFAIHHVERQRRGRSWQYSVNGVCGNGLIETDVLVEPDAGGSVTFADLSIAGGSDISFLAEVNRSDLESELLMVAESHCNQRYAPKPVSRLFQAHYEHQPVRVAETGPVWHQVG
jgi:hypothetical protein